MSGQPTSTQCPDCFSGLRSPFLSCTCGWTAPAHAAERLAEAMVSTVRCDTPGCDQPAFVREGDKNACRRCYEGNVNSKSFEACKAKGLTTVEDMQRYCREMFKKGVFGRPSFETWAENMRQGTVDRLVLMNGPDDVKVLGRLRAMCVIDEQNQIIPQKERPALREERAGRIQAERERADALLKAQGVVRRPGIDTEQAA